MKRVAGREVKVHHETLLVVDAVTDERTEQARQFFEGQEPPA